MKDDEPVSPAQSEQDMLRILQTERDAEHAIRNCANEAQQIIDDVQARVQRIESRADQRISNMEMRYGHKLNRIIRDIEREGAAEISNDASLHYNEQGMQAVIKKLAIDLCLGGSLGGLTHDDGSEAGK